MEEAERGVEVMGLEERDLVDEEEEGVEGVLLVSDICEVCTRGCGEDAGEGWMCAKRRAVVAVVAVSSSQQCAAMR